MRPFGSMVLAAVAVLGVVVGGGRFAAAQDSDGGDQPAVGSWLVESDPGDAEYSVRLVTLFSDGTALFVSGQATMGVGAWKPAGETAAVVTLTAVTDGPAYIVIRANLDIAPDGLTFTGSFTNEIVFDPAGGGTSGEIGPGTLEGVRLAAEAPGMPGQSFDEFFAPPGGTPVATPAP